MTADALQRQIGESAASACDLFTPSPHPNRYNRINGESARCTKCRQQNWRHWLKSMLAALRTERGEVQTPEICICAAWQTEEGYIVRGHRHSHCMQAAIEMKLTPSRAEHAQGFITSRGRFVDRTEGAELMRAVHFESQFTGKQFEGDTLFSEDLYAPHPLRDQESRTERGARQPPQLVAAAEAAITFLDAIEWTDRWSENTAANVQHELEEALAAIDRELAASAARAPHPERTVMPSDNDEYLHLRSGSARNSADALPSASVEAGAQHPAENTAHHERTEPVSEKPLTGLWRDNPDTPEGKYLVKRRDGTVVDWPNFVIGARDPAAPAALLAYAGAAEALGFNAEYVADVRRLAEDFARYREAHGAGDPDRGRHRVDDPVTVAEMRRGGSA